MTATATKPRVARTSDDIPGFIRSRTAFRTRIRKEPYGTFISMSGQHHEPGHGIAAGVLPSQYVPYAETARFIVYSYDTPIAWWLDEPTGLDPDAIALWLADQSTGLWVFPQVAYTRTTTQHVGTAESAMRPTWQAPDRTQLPNIRLSLPDAPARVPYVGCSREYY